MNPFAKKQKGDRAEQLACDYLQNQGLKFVDNNFTSRFGEIDLIMRDPRRDNLVFIEVRYRKNTHFGGAAVSVVPKKQHRIIKTALYYMQQHEPDASARFDVVAIEGDMASENAINWIIDAFQ
jgi:putative endonuclease